MGEPGGLAVRLAEVREKIALAASKSDRAESEITLVAVSKGQPDALIMEAYESGLRIFGENYPEEGLKKMEAFSIGAGVQWHMIGHVQSRKARMVAQSYDLVHSVDSLKVAHRIDRFAGEYGRILPVLLEFNVSGEQSKYGWMADRQALWAGLLEDVSKLLDLSNIETRGLMTIAPYFSKKEHSREIFQQLRRLRDFLADHFPSNRWAELSMGMSSDYDIAIEEGATVIRIGEAIFGPRPVNSE